MTVKALKRQLMAAIAMIMVSLIALSSSTYAWFTMNKTVTATGLNITARTEGGIVIKEEGSTLTAKESVTFTTAQNSAIKLLPTSTSDLSTWVHANAADENSNAAIENTYTVLNLVKNNRTAGYVGFGTVLSNGVQNHYYAYDIFQISRDPNSKSFTDLYVSTCTVNKVEANGTASTQPMTSDLDKSIRVAVKCGDIVKIFAPLSEDPLTYTVVTNVGEVDGVNKPTATTEVTAIPSKNSDVQPLLIGQTQLVDDTIDSSEGVKVEVYVYFEGEDQDHKTKNIGVLDNLSVTLKFSCSYVTPKD